MIFIVQSKIPSYLCLDLPNNNDKKFYYQIVCAQHDDDTTTRTDVETELRKYLTDTPTLIMNNLREYLNQYRIITDTVQIRNGFVINFGVIFDVVAHKYANKSEVKVRCFEAIKKYFNIDKMKFR